MKSVTIIASLDLDNPEKKGQALIGFVESAHIYTIFHFLNLVSYTFPGQSEHFNSHAFFSP